MDLRRLLAALGAGIATFVVVAVLVIEGLAVEFSAIVGLPVGAAVGLAAVVGLLWRYDDLGRPARAAVDGLAGAGFAVVLVGAGSYVNLLALAVEVTAGVVVAAGVLAGIVSWSTDS